MLLKSALAVHFLRGRNRKTPTARAQRRRSLPSRATTSARCLGSSGPLVVNAIGSCDADRRCVWGLDWSLESSDATVPEDETGVCDRISSTMRRTSLRAASETLGGPIVIPAQRARSNIHAGMTTPASSAITPLETSSPSVPKTGRSQPRTSTLRRPLPRRTERVPLMPSILLVPTPGSRVRFTGRIRRSPDTRLPRATHQHHEQSRHHRASETCRGVRRADRLAVGARSSVRHDLHDHRPDRRDVLQRLLDRPDVGHAATAMRTAGERCLDPLINLFLVRDGASQDDQVGVPTSLVPWNGEDPDAEKVRPGGTPLGSPPSASPATANSRCGASRSRFPAPQPGAEVARPRHRSMATPLSTSTCLRAQRLEPRISLQTHSRANGKRFRRSTRCCALNVYRATRDLAVGRAIAQATKPASERTDVEAELRTKRLLRLPAALELFDNLRPLLPTPSHRAPPARIIGSSSSNLNQTVPGPTLTLLLARGQNWESWIFAKPVTRSDQATGLRNK
jgi:hypothetical protein